MSLRHRRFAWKSLPFLFNCNHTGPYSKNSTLNYCQSTLSHLFDQNKAWASRITAQHPTFFQDLAKQQSPELLWIGCSDSRVPANQIIDMLPGQVFVHRNIANIVHATDFNLLAVLQFSVEVLKVKSTHWLVCNYYESLFYASR